MVPFSKSSMLRMSQHSDARKMGERARVLEGGVDGKQLPTDGAVQKFRKLHAIYNSPYRDLPLEDFTKPRASF